jgi:hypothetical protein
MLFAIHALQVWDSRIAGVAKLVLGIAETWSSQHVLV